MKSLINTVLAIIVATIVCQLLELQIAKNLKILEMLGIGLIIGKFALDYYKNRKTNPSYLKYAIYSAIAFLVYNVGLFSFNRIPFTISLTFLLFALLVFSLIGVNDSLKTLNNLKESKKKGLAVFYLVLFATHSLYAFVAASSFLKDYNLFFLIPGILIFDLIVLLPFIIIKKAYNQLLLMGLFVVSLSINTYAAAYLLNMPGK